MDIQALISLIITIFLLMVCGFIARKTGVINDASSKGISGVLNRIGMPFLIFNALISAEHTEENAKAALRMILIGFFIHFLFAVIAYFAAKPIKDFDERKMSEFSLVFNNCGFVGLPVLKALFGPEGVFLGSFFLLSFNVLLRTWGMAILSRKRKDIKITLFGVLVNHGTVPCALGMLIYFLKIPLPTSVMTCCSYLSSICTPLSLIVTGGLLATAPLGKIFSSWKIYYISAMKLLVMPILICIITKLIGFDGDTVVFCTVMAAIPTAAASTMFGDIYNISPQYSSAIVSVTSLLSVATLPLMVYFAQWFISLW